MKCIMSDLYAFLLMNVFFLSRVFVDGVNTVQFTKFTSLKCDDVAMCATSSPAISFQALSLIQCGLECQSRKDLLKTLVGVNYREQSKVCEMFSANPTSFANVQGCQYMQKEGSTPVQCSAIRTCSTSNGGCDTNAKCTGSRGDTTCTCNAGYTGNGTVCTDINECLTNNGGCSPNATCNNTVGSFTCACLNAYFGNGFNCTLVNTSLVIQAITGDAQRVNCTSGQLLSCGNDNYQSTYVDNYRYTVPISSAYCECRHLNGMYCAAWCTNAVSGFEIVQQYQQGWVTFSVSCSAGKKVLGCHYLPNTALGQENYRMSYPTADGGGCNCFTDKGITCVATCAANIRNHEVVNGVGSGDVVVSCPAGKFVLGCGMLLSANGIEYTNSIRVLSASSCKCYRYFSATCYAICGQFN